MYKSNFIKKLEMDIEIQFGQFNSSHTISNFQSRDRVVCTV
jgi:hypothetical protein